MYKTLSSNIEDNLAQIKTKQFSDFIRTTINGAIPKASDITILSYKDRCGMESDELFDIFAEECYTRDVYTKFCSWPIVTDEWISSIAELLRGKKCIEIMAGNGLISHALQIHGVDIMPYDNFSWESCMRYTTVYEMDAITCADTLKFDYIVCSWPPCGETDICMVLKKMHYKNPNAKMIYIGEALDGITACDQFFKMTSEINKGNDARLIDEANRNFKRFYAIHDRIHLLQPNANCRKYHN